MLEEGTLFSKAYHIDFNKIYEGYLATPVICYAKNRNEAKNKLLSMVKYEGWVLNSSGEELTYLNIPVRRLKDADIIVFEGQGVQRCKIASIVEERERINKIDTILANPDVKYCYIWKGGYYYRPNNRGYTSLRFDAGVYLKSEAVSEAKSVREITLEPIDIYNHNKMIHEKISELESRLIF
jgi:hypothetical protein